MQDPRVLTYLIDKRITRVEIQSSYVVLYLSDGDMVWIASDWDVNPLTLDAEPRPPVINFNLQG